MKESLKYLLVISVLVNFFLGYFVFKLYNSEKQVNHLKPAEIENTKNSTTDLIYFVGNSIFKGTDWSKLLDNDKIVNQSVSGITTTDAVMMSNELIPDKPEKVFIMLGVNDIKSQIPLNVTIRNLGHFVYTLKRFSPKTKIYILSVLPVNEKTSQYQIKNENVKQLNKVIKDFCSQFNFDYIDLYDILLDAELSLDKKYTKDGLHLNEAAYIELSKTLKKYVAI